MDAIERAIRNALEKGPSDDRTFREKVYRQAFGALERALQANPNVTVETAIRRRKGLQAKITEIEAEFLPALPPLASDALAQPAAPPEVSIDAGEYPGSNSEPELTSADGQPEPELVPVLETPAEGGLRPEPTFTGHIQMRPDAPASTETIPIAPDIRIETSGGPTPVVPDIMLETEPEQTLPEEAPTLAGSSGAVEPDRDARRAERKRPFAAIFFTVTLLCAAAIGIWWAIQTGLINPPNQDITGIEEPPAQSEDFEPGVEGEPIKPGQADMERQWISVFAPNDPSTVSAPGDAKAQVAQEAAGDFMRIQSGASGSAIIFDVGQGVLEQIAGKKATFDIVARAQEGKDTQMSVACNFSELGDCGRKRYAVGPTRADYLFEIQMPAATPGAGGTIAINSDFSNSGKAVDIFEIKVSIAP